MYIPPLREKTHILTTSHSPQAHPPPPLIALRVGSDRSPVVNVRIRFAHARLDDATLCLSRLAHRKPPRLIPSLRCSLIGRTRRRRIVVVVSSAEVITARRGGFGHGGEGQTAHGGRVMRHLGERGVHGRRGPGCTGVNEEVREGDGRDLERGRGDERARDVQDLEARQDRQDVVQREVLVVW